MLCPVCRDHPEVSVTVELTRRALFTSAAVGGSTALVAARAASAAAPLGRLPRTVDPAVHAARRLTFGATPAVVARIRSVGLPAWVDEQLSAGTDVNGAVAAVGETSAPLPSRAFFDTGIDAVPALQTATFARAVWADNQLAELLVEFWSNHLSVNARSDQVGDLKVADERDVARRYALGTFTDMLVASAQSPAMLCYLSNNRSIAPKPNENYARELLELHTVGVHGGYGQRDVVDAARALTGLTVDGSWQFTYRPEWHVTGPLRVLGWTDPNADAAKGLEVALSLVRYLAGHPATARHLATKLVRRFVADEPPPALVASAASVYLSNGTSIVPVVRHILTSREFAESADRKVQRSFEWLAASARALGLQQDPSMHVDGNGVLRWLEQLGQLPFTWPQPDGFPDTARAWASTATLLGRWNAAQALVTNNVAGFRPLDVDALVGAPLPTTVGSLVDRLTQRILCQPVRPALTRALVRSTSSSAGQAIDQTAVRRMAPAIAALILSSPEAQVR